MARIQASSTLVNQYAPPFVVSNNVDTNWQLRWSETLQAFEAFDPNENVIEAGFDVIESALFSNVTQQVFVVPWAADSKESLIITIDGAKQQQDAYTVSVDANSNTTVVTLFDTVSNETVEILGLQTTGGASIELYTDTGDNLTTDFLLTWFAPSVQSLIITLDGIKQDTNKYSIVPNATFTATTVSFNTAPGLNVEIEIIGITTSGETPASPVNVANALTDAAPTTLGLFKEKTVTGDTQVFTFKNISAGANVTLADGAGSNSVEITAVQPTIANLSVGGTDISVIPGTTDDVELRQLTAINGVSLSVTGELITVTSTDVYLQATGTSPTIENDDRIIGFEGTVTGAVVTTLPPVVNFYSGEKIILKDEGGNAGTNNITLNTAGGELIDGQATYVINTDYGYVVLYSDGINFFVIAQG